MRLDQLIADTVGRLIGRIVRRGIAAGLLGLCLLVVIYQLTVAGTLALGDAYGMVIARLMIAAVFALAAGGALGFLLATRSKPKAKTEDVLRQPQTFGIALLLESLLLGYSLTRGKGRSGLKRT